MILEKNGPQFFLENRSTFNDTAPKMGKIGQNQEFLKIPRF